MDHALVIGVASTDYGDGFFGHLPGVNDDVAAVSAFLAQRGIDVSICASGDDTRASAVAALLVRFIDLTGPGDLGIIYLAGHGYQVPDTSGDDSDGWDESFVCSDQPILDDWWRDSLWSRVRPGARIVTVVDACHASTIILGLREVQLPPVPIPPPVTKDYYRLTLSACRDDETTLDDVERDDVGGGVVTTVMLDFLRREPTLSYRELWTDVATEVRDRYGSSTFGTPQLLYHGPDDSLLASTAFEPLPDQMTPPG